MPIAGRIGLGFLLSVLVNLTAFLTTLSVVSLVPCRLSEGYTVLGNDDTLFSRIQKCSRDRLIHI